MSYTTLVGGKLMYDFFLTGENAIIKTVRLLA